MQLEGLQHTTDEIETLRLILEADQKRPIAYDEALEIGESLISYFKTLAEEPTDTEEE
jgi:hypothetical protein